VLKTKFKDSCVRINGKVSLVKNIVLSNDDKMFVVYQSFQQMENFFTVPLESNLLGIVIVSNLDNNIQVAKLCDIDAI
jgi:hypothetical protein